MFHQTPMGRKFFEADVPRLIKALEDIAKQLQKLNNDDSIMSSGCIVDLSSKSEKSVPPSGTKG